MPHWEIVRINRVIQVCLTESKNVRRVQIIETSDNCKSFSEMCDSKLSGLHNFDNMVMINRVKNGQSRKVYCKFMRQPSFSSILQPSLRSHLSNQMAPRHLGNICQIKWHPGTLEISTLLKIAVGAHFHVWHDTKSTPVFFPVDVETF